ncbi:MAG: hypothetical protein ACRDYY_16400 [Acidimicrobiales bacterium]
MSGERFVLLGLAPPRAAWFEAVARWANSATIAAEFVKCVSAEEVRARLVSGRRHSALLIDAGLPAFDRDMVDVARSAFTPVIAVRDTRSPALRDGDLGLAAQLPAGFGPDQLLDVLALHCQMVGRGDQLPPTLEEPSTPLWLGEMFSVCGPGGTGASSLAIALAQGLAADARHGRRVLLADLARRAEQAMLHDAEDLGPGLQELVESHRLGRPAPDEVVHATFDVPSRRYRLLLGLRQPDGWAALRPRAIDATIEGLRRSFQVVVADVEGDVEGEDDGGSVDVEERNHLARAAVQRSGVVVVVGLPGMKGIHSLAGQIRCLVRAGVSPGRMVAVLNRAPRNPRARAELSRALVGLLASEPAGGGSPGRAPSAPGGLGGLPLANPVHVPERKLEDIHRNVASLPAAVVHPVVAAVLAVSERQADSAPAQAGATLITPGSLGSWPEAAESG